MSFPKTHPAPLGETSKPFFSSSGSDQSRSHIGPFDGIS
jgi:hypothetical protein